MLYYAAFLHPETVKRMSAANFLAREGDLARAVRVTHYLIVRRQIACVNEMQTTKVSGRARRREEGQREESGVVLLRK